MVRRLETTLLPPFEVMKTSRKEVSVEEDEKLSGGGYRVGRRHSRSHGRGRRAPTARVGRDRGRRGRGDESSEWTKGSRADGSGCLVLRSDGREDGQ